MINVACASQMHDCGLHQNRVHLHLIMLTPGQQTPRLGHGASRHSQMWLLMLPAAHKGARLSLGGQHAELGHR